MTRYKLIAVLFGGSMITFAARASAQFYPWGGYDGWGGAAGAAALLGGDYRQAAAIQAGQQSRQFGQQAAVNQNYVVQSGIRNTLSSQAMAQTNAAIAQGQANQDWFFQYQSQQDAQRRAAAYASASPAISMPYGAAAGPRAFGPSGGPPPVATDIIQWPTALQASCFASERAQIEAPYRRTPPKLSIPTKADYKRMVGVIEDMKAVLEWTLKEGVRTSDYNAASAFLGRIEQEATAQANRGS